MVDAPRRKPRRIERCFSIADLRYLARRKLPAPIFHYIDGGADDEFTLQRNSAAYDDIALLPQLLRDVTTVDATTSLFGVPTALPLMLAPTGASRLFHHTGEPAVARAAARSGLVYSLSTVSTVDLETVAAASDGPKLFQLYVVRDRAITNAMVARAKAAGYRALCLTIDTVIAGNRERDVVTGMTMPPRLTPASLLSFAAHPAWTINMLRSGPIGFANFNTPGMRQGGSDGRLTNFIGTQFDRALSWRDAEALAAEWNGPFVVKGIQSVDDARRAVLAGATALMLSNHGGRQCDGVLAPIELLPRVRDAIGDVAEVIVDGGIRRGAHVVKAMALGASACAIGRAYLYGLAAGGEAGVDRALELLRAEIERTMTLIGCTRPDEIGRAQVTLDRWPSLLREVDRPG